MDNEQILSIAVSVGKIESTVTEIKENTNRRLGNVEQTVITLSNEQIKQGHELAKTQSALSTSYKWMALLVTVIGIVVGIIMNLVTG